MFFIFAYGRSCDPRDNSEPPPKDSSDPIPGRFMTNDRGLYERAGGEPFDVCDALVSYLEIFRINDSDRAAEKDPATDLPRGGLNYS